MNKRLFYAVVLLAIAFVGLSSSTCSPDPEPEKNYYVNVDQSTVSFDRNGGSTTVLIKSNTSWKISGIPDWLTVSPASGTNDAAVTLSTSASSTRFITSLSWFFFSIVIFMFVVFCFACKDTKIFSIMQTFHH